MHRSTVRTVTPPLEIGASASPRSRGELGAEFSRVVGSDSLTPDPYRVRVSVEWEQVVVDARDPVALGQWWLEALDWVIVNDDPDEFEIRPHIDQLPGMLFEPVTEVKQNKNRLHLDFRPDDQDAEVERLVALGATRVDVGQGDASWVVLADPEGNEFCVLRNRTKAISRPSAQIDR